MARLIRPSFDEGLTHALEAVAAGGVVLWRWRGGRLALTGALDAAGLCALSPECGPEALFAYFLAADHDAIPFLSTALHETGELVTFSARLAEAGAGRVRFRGAWLGPTEAAGVAERLANGADAEHDALTGLLSRSGFLAAAEDQVLEPRVWRLFAADVARLRRLNEALGPEGADTVLKALAARLTDAFAAPGLAARVGEDEFALLMEDGPALVEGADRLRAALERPLRVQGYDIHPTLWVAETRFDGGAGAPAPQELLRRAALALEAARSPTKTLSSAPIKVAADDSLSRLALEADLHGALQRGEITPFYQPIAHLGSGRLAGFEALARWRHPVRGLVAPDNFLPLMAEAGLMTTLGRHMIRTASAQIGAWRRAHPDAGELFVAVNLSTGELEDERLTGFVAENVRINGLAPRALKLEITESDIMRDPERAAVVLEDLRRAGAGISLDDFGTGFSSLAYLTRLPFETLKIDRYFVKTMAENDGSKKIVRSVATLGRDLGMEVVAEGVETLAVARQLHAMGCEFGQGFGYAPALDPQAAEVYLNEAYLDEAAPIRVTA